MTWRGARLLLALAAAMLTADLRSIAASDEQLWTHRNLGKAFYENPTTQYLAVEEFAKALALAPESARERVNYGLALLRAGKTAEGMAELERVQRQDASIPHTWFNLGIQYKKQATPDAIARATLQFERMIGLVPDEPISHYNLGYLYKISGRAAEATRQFEIASRLDPNLAGPHFQLYNAYRDPAVGRAEDAARELAIFQRLKKQQAGAVIPEDLEWSFFSEIWDPIDPAAREAVGPLAAPAFRERDLGTRLDAPTAGLLLLPAGPGEPAAALAWSRHGVHVLAGGDTLVTPSGLEQVRDIVAVAAGDLDNDGRIDLAIVGRDGVTLWRGSAGHTFAPHAAPLPAGAFTTAFWFDHDHDYDLDLLLLGERSYLFRNAGEAGFTDATAEFPFVAGRPLAVTAFEAIADTIGVDLVVSYDDRAGVLYRDRLAGRYDALPLKAVPQGTRELRLIDFNHDSWMDLAVNGPAGAAVLMNQTGQLQAVSLGPGAGGAFATADFHNDGVVDLLAGDRVWRWTPGGVQDVALRRGAAARLAADLDDDGRADLLEVDAGGALRLATNAATATGRWVRVALEGVKNLKMAPGAEVEVKAGSRYLKALYTGTPLLFGLGQREAIETVRITWPNGLIQNEPRQAAGRTLRFKEAPRLSGSCPMIFAWDGTRFGFITDVLGVAPLGVGIGEGEYLPVDRDEYVHISGDALVPRQGEYEIRVTEELREVAYLDRIQLSAVDYPATLTLVTNEKFKAPPFSEFELFGVEQPLRPRAARDHRGSDVLDRVLRVDRRYADTFHRDAEGVAEPHYLELDFAADAPAGALLVATGWVDWADGSTFRGIAQERPDGLTMPSIQVQDARGRWQTVVADMGLPAGKTKTIAVDLTGRFLSASRAVRIVTSVAVYWDEVYLAAPRSAPPARITPLEMRGAVLGFHGFSRLVFEGEGRQPEAFDYHDVQPLSMWNPTPGLYTRFGDVGQLLATDDDELVVMGSGDEVRLRFDASALPPLAPGWKRDFLLYFAGYAKDGDANTAFSQSVAPLPFRAMRQYPHGPDQSFPRPEYARQYNTRPALRLLRPLAHGGSR